jgi:hypothetical protein
MSKAKPGTGFDNEPTPDQEELAARARDATKKDVFSKTIKAFGKAEFDLHAYPIFWVMLGGDEVFVAASPVYAGYAHEIIRDLDQIKWWNGTLNMRAAVSYSSAKRVRDPAKQREENQRVHDKRLKLANSAPGKLKKFERMHRRIERLILKLEANDKNKNHHKAPDYSKELEKLKLMKMFVRVQHGKSENLSSQEFAKLRKSLVEEKFGEEIEARDWDYVNFEGNLIDDKKLWDAAENLFDRLNRDVGLDNKHFDMPPLLTKMPKIIEKRLKKWEKKGFPWEDGYKDDGDDESD